MIDDEVQADVRGALAMAAAVPLERHRLDGVRRAAGDERTTDLHPTWRSERALPGHVRDALAIGRSDLVAVARECRASGRWAPLLTSVNAWGYGESGYGVWRTRRILALADIEDRLDAAVATLDGEGPVAAYYLLNNEGHLHGWGPALFTRFLEVVDLREAEGALGLDTGSAHAVNALVPCSDLGAADWGTAEYAFYLALVHRIAADLALDAPIVVAALASEVVA